MSDPRDPLAALPAVDPSDAAAREARHEVILGLLGAYVDRELPAETTSQLDAHLVGCARCRRELAVQAGVRGRLAAEPTAGAARALRARISETLATMPPAAPASPEPARSGHRRAAALVAVTALAATTAVAVLESPWRGESPAGPRAELVEAAVGTDALLRGVVADFRRVVAGDLPGRARDVDAVRGAVPFPVEPLRAPELRLLAAWTTDLAGEPAAVLAYRWNDRVVLQYLVDEARFFRSPAVRRGVEAGHLLSAREGDVSVLAWPTDHAGTLLVGQVPVERLAPLWSAERLADRVAGGAQ